MQSHHKMTLAGFERIDRVNLIVAKCSRLAEISAPSLVYIIGDSSYRIFHFSPTSHYSPKLDLRVPLAFFTALDRRPSL
jgi:hypothetical protein